MMSEGSRSPADFRGTGVALVTPFGDDGGIDRRALRAHVERQIEAGIDVLVPCGSTGEAAAMTADEQREVLAETVDVAAGRVPVLAGAASSSTSGAVRLAERAREAGADAVLAGTPPYNRPPQEGLYRHFRTVAEEAGLPVVVYNVPSRTGSNVLPETVLRLAELDGVWGIKEASGSLPQVMTILRDRPDGFVVLSGEDELAIPIMALGGDGVISVAANEVPGEMSGMVRAALEGRFDEASRMHFRLLELMRANFAEANPIPVKAALAYAGHMSGVVRPPLVPPSDAARRRVEEALDGVLAPVEAS